MKQEEPKQMTNASQYIEWSDQTAAIVRASGADTVITGEEIRQGPINYLDDPRQNFDDGITPTQAADEIIRRLEMLNR